MKLDLTKKVGPFTLRAWGLIVNFFANALALYGLSQVLKENGGQFEMYSGIALTLLCIFILSKPNSD